MICSRKLILQTENYFLGSSRRTENLKEICFGPPPKCTFTEYNVNE